MFPLNARVLSFSWSALLVTIDGRWFRRGWSCIHVNDGGHSFLWSFSLHRTIWTEQRLVWKMISRWLSVACRYHHPELWSGSDQHRVTSRAWISVNSLCFGLRRLGESTNPAISRTLLSSRTMAVHLMVVLMLWLICLQQDSYRSSFKLV